MAHPVEQADHSPQHHPEQPEMDAAGAPQDAPPPPPPKNYLGKALLGAAIVAVVLLASIALFGGGLGSGDLGLFTVNHLPVTTVEGGIAHGLSKAFEFLVKSPIAWAAMGAGALGGLFYEHHNVKQAEAAMPDGQDKVKIRELAEELAAEKEENKQLATNQEHLVELMETKAAEDQKAADIKAAEARGATEARAAEAAARQAQPAATAQPSQPAPAQPAPAQPAAAQPAPAQPAPAQQQPAAAPAQPQPVVIVQAEPARTEPAPVQPASVQPAPAQITHNTTVVHNHTDNSVNNTANTVNNVQVSHTQNNAIVAVQNAEGNNAPGQDGDIHLRNSAMGDRSFRASELKRRVERTQNIDVKNI